MQASPLLIEEGWTRRLRVKGGFAGFLDHAATPPRENFCCAQTFGWFSRSIHPAAVYGRFRSIKSHVEDLIEIILALCAARQGRRWSRGVVLVTVD